MGQRAGKLSRRVTLQVPVKVRDSFGQELENWQDVSPKVWANVTWMSGGESFTADQRSARQSVEFEIRYRAGLAPKRVRVVHDGQIYDVEDVREIGRRRGLVLTAYAHEVVSGRQGA